MAKVTAISGSVLYERVQWSAIPNTCTVLLFIIGHTATSTEFALESSFRVAAAEVLGQDQGREKREKKEAKHYATFPSP